MGLNVYKPGGDWCIRKQLFSLAGMFYSGEMLLVFFESTAKGLELKSENNAYFTKKFIKHWFWSFF